MHGLAIAIAAILCGQAPTATLGARVEIGDGAFAFIPKGYRAKADKVHVVMHLHGASSTLEPAVVASGWNVVLIEFNRNGLSGVYTKPFSDPALFGRLIDATLKVVSDKGLATNPVRGKVIVSSFSAGFGGVREMLKIPAIFDQIDAIILEDSLYSGYEGDPKDRKVSPLLMSGFEKFAKEAVEGRKTLLITHSSQTPEGYASTTETADYLIAAVGAKAEPVEVDWKDGWKQTRQCKKGTFLVLGFAGAEAADHVRHLRRIAEVWQRIPVDLAAMLRDRPA